MSGALPLKTGHAHLIWEFCHRANSTLSDEDNDTAANSDIATTPASSPNVESTVVDTVTIASLSSQVVTATVTRLATPTYPGGMANDAGSSDGANRFRGHEDDDSGAVLLSVSLGCAVTTLLAFGIVFA